MTSSSVLSATSAVTRNSRERGLELFVGFTSAKSEGFRCILILLERLASPKWKSPWESRKGGVAFTFPNSRICFFVQSGKPTERSHQDVRFEEE